MQVYPKILQYFSIVTVVAGVVFCSNPAFADKKLSLVSVSPGSALFEAFGHSMVLVEDSTTPNEAVLYEFGGVDMGAALSGSTDTEAILNQFTQLFQSKVSASGLVLKSKYREATEHEPRIPELLYRRYLHKKSTHRAIQINLLDLTQDQIQVVEQELNVEIQKGPYQYQNFKNNCVTKIRDILFSEKIYGKPAFFEDKIEKSYQELSKEDIDFAIAQKCLNRDSSCDPSIDVLPSQLARTSLGKKALSQLGMLGIPKNFKSSSEMEKVVVDVDQSLPLMIGIFFPQSELPKAFHEYFLGADMIAKPHTRWEVTYTPKELLSALLESAKTNHAFSELSVDNDSPDNL